MYDDVYASDNNHTDTDTSNGDVQFTRIISNDVDEDVYGG